MTKDGLNQAKSRWARIFYGVAAASLATAVLTGCALHAATSGRVAISDKPAGGGPSITAADRAAIDRYYASAAKSGMPPAYGLSKGRVLPSGARTESLPSALARSLSALPGGYEWLKAGRDIFILDRASKIVVDVFYEAAR